MDRDHPTAATEAAQPRTGAASRPASPLDARIAPGLLAGALVGWLGLDLLLLWRFIGFAPWWAFVAGAALVAILVRGVATAMPNEGGPTVRTLATCFAIACLLYLLGGQGRIFYANVDWQVRDGVLHDMATHPWPYAYTARGLPEMLRAPLGMYLVPALVMGAAGQTAGDWALLLQNSVLLALVFALCAPLFPTAARRVTAMAVFLAFSGLDIIRALIFRQTAGWAVPDHLEWASGVQYSSHITQAFWVPQHALAGWICAAGFMLWHDRRMPLGVLLALVPLVILWSPLSPIGSLPFIALAAGLTLWRRTLQLRDITLPALATLLAVPTLLYLSAAGASVGGQPFAIDRGRYLLLLSFDVLPFLFPLVLFRRHTRFGWPVLALVAASLLTIPLGQIGQSADFMMRASIPALAILAVIIADMLIDAPRAAARIVLATLLAIGAITGLHEINRAVMWPASPPPRCSFYHAWGTGPASARSTYLAPVEQLPAIIRPSHVTLMPDTDPAACWARPWPRPTGI